MSKSVVLLLDLQTDFLDGCGRMPVDPRQALTVIDVANAILTEKALRGSIPISIVNQFPASARFANYFRNKAAIAGSDGARQDARIAQREDVAVFPKERASAFSNSGLVAHLKSLQIEKLYVLGVFAEGCVRATVQDAIRLGFKVLVVENAIATNAGWKRRFALWSMRRAGASFITLVS